MSSSCLYEHSSVRINELDEQTLLLQVGGDVREEDVEPFFEALETIVEGRSAARILVDATYFGETKLRLRWQIVRRLREVREVRERIERTAIYGLSPKLEALLWLVFTLGRRTNIRTFLWRHEAENWVLGSPTSGYA